MAGTSAGTKKGHRTRAINRMPRLAESAYAQYEAMGPSRSLAKLAKVLSAGGGNYSSKLRQLQHWSAAYGWQDLTREYDRGKAAEEGEKWRNELRKLNDEQQKIARAGRAQMFAALSRLARIDATAIEDAERKIKEWQAACVALPAGATPPAIPRLNLALTVNANSLIAAFSEFAALERLTMGAATEIHSQEEGELPIRVILTRDDDDADQHPEKFPFSLDDGADDDDGDDSERSVTPPLPPSALSPADFIAEREAMLRARLEGSAPDGDGATIRPQQGNPFAGE